MNRIRKILDKGKGSIASNMIISGICKPISMIISYLYVPVVLNYLGIEKYGVWSIILTILSWISYFDIGIGNGLRNRLTESLNRKDGKSRTLVSSTYAFTAVIMSIVSVLFAIGASFVDWNRMLGVEEPIHNLGMVVTISIIFVAINFVLSICKNILYALQKAADVSCMELMIQLLNMGGVLLAERYFESNLFIMAVIHGGSMITVNFIASLLIYLKNREVRPGYRYIDITAGKNLMNLGVQFFVIQICALILFATDSVIISYLYGAAAVTPYHAVNRIFNVIIGSYTAILAPIWSAVTKVKVEKNYTRLTGVIKRLQLTMIPFALGTVLLMIIFRPLMRLWLGRELEYSTELICMGGTYCLLSIWCNTYASVANGLELLKISMKTAVCQAAMNIPLSVFLAEIMNMKSAGVLAGTVLSMAVDAIIMPIVVHSEIRKRRQEET
ncbi:MAG: oligosaccharide flippase family protein [Blautia sp.]|nr:oligosaccharide flippase family protein [Blautia sp.]MCM1201830.1 oligosaccharide flippase family protein [Bacteroides fragilis]